MKMKITYLFGAGASCETLPIASKLGEDIGTLSNEIVDLAKKHSSKTEITGEPLIESLHWLSIIAKDHYTIDTIAKKLFMRNNANSIKMLGKLKATLLCYLWYRQLRKPSDKRYDGFLATILQTDNYSNPVLPNSLRFLTWNYDILFERAFYEFCESYDYMLDYIFKGNKIIHLNGMSDVVPYSNSPLSANYQKYKKALFQNTKEPLEYVIELFIECMDFPSLKSIVPQISFAWEDKKYEEAQSSVRDTNKLVVIGYSFPYFNRNIDKYLITSFISTLDEIVLQVNKDVGCKERLLSMLKEIDDSKQWLEIIKDKEDTTLFFIPNEILL
jgi:hypothetical protein